MPAGGHCLDSWTLSALGPSGLTLLLSWAFKTVEVSLVMVSSALKFGAFVILPSCISSIRFVAARVGQGLFSLVVAGIAMDSFMRVSGFWHFIFLLSSSGRHSAIGSSFSGTEEGSLVCEGFWLLSFFWSDVNSTDRAAVCIGCLGRCACQFLRRCWPILWCGSGLKNKNKRWQWNARAASEKWRMAQSYFYGWLGSCRSHD